MNDSIKNERITFLVKLMVLCIQPSMHLSTIQSLVKLISLSFEHRHYYEIIYYLHLI
jgi:hypothetical protein